MDTLDPQKTSLRSSILCSIHRQCPLPQLLFLLHVYLLEWPEWLRGRGREEIQAWLSTFPSCPAKAFHFTEEQTEASAACLCHSHLLTDALLWLWTLSSLMIEGYEASGCPLSPGDQKWLWWVRGLPEWSSTEQRDEERRNVWLPRAKVFAYWQDISPGYVIQ